MINYPDLIKRYMAHVYESDGSCYTPDKENVWSDQKFSQEEVDFLCVVSKEIEGR